MSPGQYLVFAICLFLTGGGLYFYSPLMAVVFGFLGLMVFVMCLSGCGHQDPSTAYQGSLCPKCGKDNRIKPWDF